MASSFPRTEAARGRWNGLRRAGIPGVVATDSSRGDAASLLVVSMDIYSGISGGRMLADSIRIPPVILSARVGGIVSSSSGHRDSSIGYGRPMALRSSRGTAFSEAMLQAISRGPVTSAAGGSLVRISARMSRTHAVIAVQRAVRII